jgi:hypothetical protein
VGAGAGGDRGRGRAAAAGGGAGGPAAGDEEAGRGEAADLVYHALVLLAARSVSLAEVVEVLRRRHRGRA